MIRRGHEQGKMKVRKRQRPDGSREGAQPEGGVPWEHPCEGASVFIDGHLHVEGAETGQQLEHLGYEQLEGKKHPIVAKVEQETPDKGTS